MSHSNVDEIPLPLIQDRADGYTRAVNFDHIFEIARSIHEVGLIEPIVVDQGYLLLAGAHRLWALKVLNLQTREQSIQDLREKANQLNDIRHFKRFHRTLNHQIQSLPRQTKFDFDRIPVRIYEIDSSKDTDQALQIEITENTQRRDYTSEEVLSLYNLLISKGYTDQRGRPKEGEKPVKAMIATIIGQSTRTVKRKLDQSKALEHATPEERHQAEVLKMIRYLSRINQSLQTLEPEIKVSLIQSIKGRAIISKLTQTLHTFNILADQ